MSKVEREPKQGSNRAKVFDILTRAKDDGLPFPGSREIAEATGLSLPSVSRARARLFRDGYLTSTLEQRRESIAHAKGTIIPLIRPYAELGMTVAEIQEAIVQEKGLDREKVSTSRIESVLGHSNRTGHPLRRRTDEEIKEARAGTLRRSPEELSQRVKSWLELRDIFIMVPDDKHPQTRSEWLFLIANAKGKEAVQRVSQYYAAPLRRGASANELAGIMGWDTSSNQEASSLARLFLDKELIGPDLMYWKCLKVIYRDAGRSMPADFADRLRLEVFLAAIMQEKRRHDTTLINKYRQLGKAVGALWFTTTLREEELFIEQDIDRRNWERANRSVPERRQVR